MSTPKSLSMKTIEDLFSKAILSQEPSPILEEMIHPGGKLDHQKAIQVYQEGYLARLTEVLGDAFETVWWILGDEDFFRVAREYILSHPSQSYNLNHYGHRFSEFLSNHDLQKESPFLSDVADFEWKFSEVFHLPLLRATDPKELQKAQNGQDFKIDFQDSFRLFSSDYSVYNLWKHRKENPDHLVQWSEPQKGILLKESDQVHIRLMSDSEFSLLQSLWSGHSLFETLSLAEEKQLDLTEQSVSDFFSNLVQMKLIHSIEQT